MTFNHVVLLGDSIFDNAVYVPGEPAVIKQLRSQLPNHWKATLLAVDGDVIRDVVNRLRILPDDATHLVVSVGGNDALGDASILDDIHSEAELQSELQEVVQRFRAAFVTMLDEILKRRLPTTVCTIYDQCPFPKPKWRELVPIALSGYNDCIIDEARKRRVTVIDLRDICTEADDYSALSPIEPSAQGGMKIVKAIVSTIGESGDDGSRSRP